MREFWRSPTGKSGARPIAAWVLVFAFILGGFACHRDGATFVADEPPVSQASVVGEEGAEASSTERPVQARGGTITLPPPRKTGGMPLMEALAARRTNRRIAEKQLPLSTLSGLLWAAVGINRPRYNKRTAPTARNSQEIDVYVALASGLYLYEPEPHRLKQLSSRDIRALTGVQSLVRSAPVDLIYVSDHSRMEDMSAAQKSHYSATDTGFVSQNVYLYCASEELATVVIGMVERGPLREAMKLAPHQEIVLTQAIGYPR